MKRQTTSRFRFKRLLLRTGYILGGIYIISCIALYFLQETLLFHPKPITQKQADSIFTLHADKLPDTVAIKMRDGINVRGWLMRDTAKKKLPLVIYFGGNAEEVSGYMSKKSELPGFHFAFFNYRGYGRSEGETSEENMFSDALEIFDRLKQRQEVDAERIFLIGRSIGTGVAVHVVKNRPVRACVLVTPYDCMANLSQEKYPVFPVKPLLKHQFNSIENAEKIKTPVLCYVASNDQVIPPWHAYNLMLNWGGNKTVRTFNGAGHNSITKEKDYWPGMRRFLSRN